MPSTRSVSSPCASASCNSTYDPQSINPDDVDKLFTFPIGSKLSIENEKDVENICCKELSDILEDCFLTNDEKDKGKKSKNFTTMEF